MGPGKLFAMFAVATLALSSVCVTVAQADGITLGTAKVVGFWATPKEEGKLLLAVPGQKDPVSTTVGAATIFAGVCLDCNLPLEFKPAESAKNCNVCGCAVSNAACIVGHAVKTNTWQAMLKQLPLGTGLVPVYNEADKPESGLKKLTVTLRALLLPITGLDGQTPEQLLAMVKPLGGTKAELLDGGKLLSVTLKSDWTAERATKLVKELEKCNAKIVSAPEEPKAQ